MIRKKTFRFLWERQIDKWLEKNKLSLDCDSYNVEELNRIISNREELYRNYFKLFQDNNGVDKIRIFYPKNGERWIRWDDKYSIDVNVNLSKGLSCGFCRVGFDYYRINGDEEKTLKCAYIENDKEIMRFNDFLCSEDNKIMIWIR